MLQKYESTKCILIQANMESQVMGFGDNSKINWLFKARVDLIMAQLYKVAIAGKSIIVRNFNLGQCKTTWYVAKYTATLRYSFFAIHWFYTMCTSTFKSTWKQTNYQNLLDDFAFVLGPEHSCFRMCC